MKFATSTAALFTLLATVNAHDHSRARAHHHKRQTVSGVADAAATGSTTGTSSTSTGTATGTTAVATGTPVTGTATGTATGTSTVSGASTTTGTPAPTTTYTTTSLLTATPSILPIQSYTFGMPLEGTMSPTTTFAAGATAPIKGAPALPTPFVFMQGQWPAQDKVVADLTSAEVTEWMKELDGWDIPDFAPTVDGSCANDPTAAADAANRGWWTCGHHTRDTDVLACPDKMTWGTSFDDGPSPFTQTLLHYLDEKNISATFFVVGSRVIERPQVLIEEYMAGHEISVHTWSHHPLTSLTNEQIVAELGWTRKAIKTVLGVTPTTMRPPYGDIDDRVRAISLAMGLVPIIWTSSPASGPFDTNDWEVAAGQVTGEQQQQTFQAILGNASTLDTGFIVLQHDLFQLTVDLARGFTLPAALEHNPPFEVKAIGQCMGWPAADMYLETTTNKTFPYANSTAGSTKGNSTSSSGSSSSNQASSSLALLAPSALVAAFVAAAGMWLA